ncbi:hypothetical protein ACE01N_07405 [Saccharicrinis sp. FJH2]|uniref:hypothetical protein n=1 Tax=Saccharicrinis sp. FJH65 TaxID=3344659 RepID=UPI0035F302B9
MKLSEIEKRFKSFMENQFNDSISKDIENGKDKVWKNVQANLPNEARSIPAWTLAAASVVIILIASFGYSGIKNRNQQIARLRTELQQRINNNSLLEEDMSEVKKQLMNLKNQPPKIDTVYKTRIVYIEKEPVTEKGNTDEDYVNPKEVENESMIRLGVDRLDLAGIQDDVESIKIEYGKKTKGVQALPWTFKVKYN